jgi:hypothetical protein
MTRTVLLIYLAIKDNVNSLELTSLDPGCSVTYYSDASCSDSATFARIGQCDGYFNSVPIRSFSWDCAAFMRIAPKPSASSEAMHVQIL